DGKRSSLFDEVRIRRKIQRVHLQLIGGGIVETYCSKIVLYLAAEAGGNSSQQVRNIRMGNDCSIDFREQSRAVRRQSSCFRGGLAAIRVNGSVQSRQLPSPEVS